MHVKAEGPLKKLLVALGVFAVLVLVGTWLEPFSAEYEVKTAAKIACNDFMAIKRSNTPNAPGTWEAKFLQQSRKAGVLLNSDQYDFQAGDISNRQEIKCHFIIAWRSVTPLLLIGELFALPPMTLVHRLDYVHAVKRNF